MRGKVGIMFLSLVLSAACGGLGAPTSLSSGLPGLLTVRAAETCNSVLERTIDEDLPNTNYELSFKGFKRTVVNVKLRLWKSKGGKLWFKWKLDARYDRSGDFLGNSNNWKIDHLIKGYRLGLHSDCERIPFGNDKFSISDEFSYGNVEKYPKYVKFATTMKDIPATKHGNCCFPCFVLEVDLIDRDSEAVRPVRAVTSEKCEKRSGGDRICSFDTICKNVIYGTEGDDVIHGTSGKDYIYGLGGDDVIIGLQGDDVIFGGDGDDTIEGGDGNDYIYGEDGDDNLDGEDGDDKIDGGDGRDEMRGGSGNDKMYGGADSDFVQGGGGDDMIFGGGGRDFLSGDSTAHSSRGGNDVIYGGSGPDQIFDTAGNNRLYGEEGNDHIFGRPGAYMDGGEGKDHLREFGEGINMYGGPGDDFIQGIGSDPLDQDGFDVHLPGDRTKPIQFG
ncbi:hypothetical protein NDN08_005350 [Rhodosorus marinus]|uniref:Calcium-binding protein n=1 Tax=Rhodosorus marinus TaxID=101924 RepID=A0AAV8V1B4_9RHOD|nr:hypothetical protein NDN08_005350 [Rhodosorus marinus]